jgi:hypothetical protein
MTRIVVGRNLRPSSLEQLSIANGAAPDAELPGDVDLVGATRLWALDEDLAAPRVDQRNAALGAGGERVQRRDPRAVHAERQRETIASSSRGLAEACRKSASTSSRSVAATEQRSPSTSPSETSALVATSVAVSKARISTRESL